MREQDGTEHRGTPERHVPITSAKETTPGESSVAERNKQLMQTLDDAWNSQDLDTFVSRHRADVVVRWPGQPETHGAEAHRQEAINFYRAFPNQRVGNRPYKMLIAQGPWTCSIAHFTGTMTGPMKGADGKDIPPTGKSFDVDFCTVAKWNEDGQIVEENLFYDLMTFMKQLGLSK
jgi:predicted ester cyclase